MNCYFSIDGNEIKVLPRKTIEYKVGDSFTYYKYTLGDIEFNSAQNFTFIKSFFLLLTITISLIFLYIFMFVDPKEEKIEKPKYTIPNDYEKLNKKGLLKVCQNANIKIPEHKTKDIKYIKQRIRNKISQDKEKEEYKKSQKKTLSNKIFNVIITLIGIFCGIIVIINYYSIATYYVSIIL